MASKAKSVWQCLNCGEEYTKERFGQCEKCLKFSEYIKVESSTDSPAQAGLKAGAAIQPRKSAAKLSELRGIPIEKFATGIGELDRVLGGGFVAGQVVLFGASPGSGKSTLALSIAEAFAKAGKKVLYSSGEESESQISLRAERMEINNDNIRIISETSLESLTGYIESEKPEFLIVDSLQTIATSEIASSSGSIAQSKEAANVLTRIAKKQGIIMLLINQVVKDENLAGSNQTTHIVDCVIMLDSDSDTPLKFLRSTKNRFGDTSEVGVFQHNEKGLAEVSDPGGILLDESDTPLPGTSVCLISEGIRQIPVEIQALVVSSNLPNPKKQFSGVNYNRGQIVCGILDKFCRAKLFDNDVFVNTVSGIKVVDPMADLSMAASIISSSQDKSFPQKMAFVGELSLTGQVRGSFMIDNKIREAQRLGFNSIVIPESAKKNIFGKHSIHIQYISSVRELVNFLR